METVLEFLSRGPGDTEKLGREIGARLQGGESIYLLGDLGAGKSLFARSVLTALGYSGPMQSPTFVLQQEYEGGQHPVLHLDLYRIEDVREVEDLGLEEYEGWIFLVEWARRFPQCLPQPHLEVEIRYTGPEERRILLQGEEYLLRSLHDDFGN